MRGLGLYYSHSDTWKGSGHLCPQSVPEQEEQNTDVNVSPHFRSPPAHPQLIIVPCIPGSSDSAEREALKQDAKQHHFIRHIYHVNVSLSSNSSLRETWHESSSLPQPAEAERLQTSISVKHTQFTGAPTLTSFLSLCPNLSVPQYQC